MLQKFRKNKSQSATEIVALLMFVLTAMLIFQKYIARGMYGRWKGVGDALGNGRLYDPNLTIECGYDRWQNTGLWYNAVCFDATCGEPDCVAETRNPVDCQECISITCRSSYGGRDICNL